MSTPQNPQTDPSAQTPASQTEEKKVQTAKKSPYGKMTSFIFAKLLLGDRFVTSFQHNSGGIHEDVKEEHGRKEKRARERLVHKTPNRIIYRVPSRTLGVFFTSFGIALLLLYLFGERLFHTDAWPLSAFVSSVIALVFGLSLIPFGMPISSLLSKSRLLTFLLCDLLLMKKLRMTEDPFGCKTRRFLHFLALVLGISLAFLSFLVSPVWILGTLLLLAFVCSAFAAPECCLVIAALLLPWLSLFDHPSTILGGLTLLLSVTFFCKVIRRKRTFTFALPDALVLILAGLYLLGGVHALGSGFYRSHGALYALLIFVYFPASNILRDRRILHHTVAALLTSGVISAIFGIYQHFALPRFQDSLDHAALGYINGRVSSFFRDGPSIFAIYLLLLFPLCLYLLTAAKRIYSRFFALFPLGLTVAALIYTWSRGAWVGAIVAFLLFVILAFRQRPTVLLIILAAIPLILLLLPDSAIQYRFASIGNMADTSIAFRLSTWKGAWNLFTDHIFAGVGAGTVSFAHAYPMYALPGTETVAHAHNLFLEMGIELGIFAPIIFILLIVVLAVITFTRPICRGSNDVRLLQVSAFAAVIGALAQSMTDYIFYNSRIVFLFFLLVGMVVACARRQAEDHVRSIDFSATSEENASAEIRFKK